MRELFKYLLLVFAAVFFWNCVENPINPLPEESVADVSLITTACQTGVSSTDHEFCPPRQINFANTQRVQNSPRRTTGTHRSNIEFTKSGKIVNACLTYDTQRKSIIVHSSHLEPIHRLLYLGKLII